MAKKKLYLVDDNYKIYRVFEFIAEIAIVCAFGLFVATYLFFGVDTESKSMEPTIQAKSSVFVNRLSYTLSNPKRFDVIAFSRGNRNESEDYLIRRIIGLPGETVRIEKGVVYINDQELDVSEYTGEITSDGIARDGLVLGEKEYFVLGDTPANSEDSRSSTIGAVHLDQIIGKVWLNYISFSEIRWIQ